MYTYSYDGCGNTLSETSSRLFEWDHTNRLATFRTQTSGADPSLYAQYRCDGAGRRVVKVVRNQGGQVAATVYIDGLFERLTLTRPASISAHDALHVLDGETRIAVVRSGPPPPGDLSPPVEYHFGDHLGSSTVILDVVGTFFNREEYTPYGETSFGSYSKKRYRYTAKERDEESGLSYHGARYYAPWVARWASCDPKRLADGTNEYEYARSNPVRFVDPSGTQATSPETGSPSYRSETDPIRVGQASPQMASSAPLPATLNAVEKFGHAAASSGAIVTEHTIWSLNWSARGFLLENLAGNNMGKNFPLVDFVDSGVVRQIKSIGSTNLKYVRGFVRGAARDTLRFTAQNVGQAGKDAEVLALMRTGTGSDVVNAARNALGGSKPLAATVRVVKGLPGVIGGAFRVLGWLGAALSAGQLADDYKRGDVASGIGNVLNVTSFGLALGAKALGAASAGAAGAATQRRP